jgi:hypothetical protein
MGAATGALAGVASRAPAGMPVDHLHDFHETDREIVVATPAGRFFSGSQIAAHACPALDDGRILAEISAELAAGQFLRRPGRGLVIAVTQRDNGPTLFGMDVRQVRRRLAALPRNARLLVPRAYALDDLTLGLLWAISNLDETLLDDDAGLAASMGKLHVYQQLPRSAVSQDVAADLARVSRMWLGSNFCAHHVLRHTDALADIPTFWTREQRGEEASTWLLFAHKYAYLHRSTHRAANSHAELTRAFCIPPSAVTGSGRPERILLLLAGALMESFGIRLSICVEPEYAAVPGFVYDQNRNAIVANWVDAEGLWQVDVTDTRPVVREFADAAHYAHSHSVTPAVSPGQRLRELADYLDLDWTWLTRRCRELADYGCGGLAQPRSHLLSLAGVERACRFLAQTTSSSPE